MSNCGEVNRIYEKLHAAEVALRVLEVRDVVDTVNRISPFGVRRLRKISRGI